MARDLSGELGPIFLCGVAFKVALCSFCLRIVTVCVCVCVGGEGRENRLATPGLSIKLMYVTMWRATGVQQTQGFPQPVVLVHRGMHFSVSLG
jgi:hypothetical protein